MKKTIGPGNNKIQIIKPYLFACTWVFDDENTGLVREPFVEGADVIIDVMVKDLKNPEMGFSLIFSKDPFPNYQIKFDRENEECGGWWYNSELLNMRGWLCPALFLYFEVAPLNLYISVA
jgi:hypothetical protein